VKKTLLNLVFGSKKWAPIEMNRKNCNLEHSKISQNKTAKSLHLEVLALTTY